MNRSQIYRSHMARTRGVRVLLRSETKQAQADMIAKIGKDIGELLSKPMKGLKGLL